MGVVERSAEVDRATKVLVRVLAGDVREEQTVLTGPIVVTFTDRVVVQ